MLSRRNYFVISIIMVLILLVFVALSIGRESLNNYNYNKFSINYEELPTSDSAWKQESAGTFSVPRKTVLYLGNENTDPSGRTAAKWCSYTKRFLKTGLSLSELAGSAENAEVLLINPDRLSEGDTERLKELSQKGLDMIFCKLPDIQKLKSDKTLAELLGIGQIVADRKELSGMRLFGGFLLGGSAEYIVKTGADRERDDMRTEIPYIRTGTGTKVYMSGMIGDDVKNEELPAVIWRASQKTSMVFAVNGDYLEDISGMGIFEAMIYELGSYDIYPVVNSQIFTLISLPDLSDENSGKMHEIYGRNLKRTYSEVVLPSLGSILSSTGFRMNCMTLMKGDINDPAGPDKDLLIYYLKELNVYKSEMGISFAGKNSAPVAQTAEQFSDFLAGNKIGYQFSGAFAREDDIPGLLPLLDKENDGIPLMRNINTVISDRKKAPVDYADKHTTIQEITNDGFSYSFSDDFRLKCYETALGYSNVAADLDVLIFPDEGSKYWEKLADSLARILSTYWKPYEVFDKNTMSESDSRIRNMLKLDYSHARTDNRVHVDIRGADGKAWFIFRVHGEEIESVSGGSFKLIENGSYLIETGEQSLEIVLKSKNKLYYH